MAREQWHLNCFLSHAGDHNIYPDLPPPVVESCLMGQLSASEKR